MSDNCEHVWLFGVDDLFCEHCGTKGDVITSAELATIRDDVAKYDAVEESRQQCLRRNSDLEEINGGLHLRIKELEAEVVELTRLHNIAYDALGSIYYHGTDKPAAMCGSDDAMWWKGVAHDCMRIAGDAFCTITQPTDSKE